MAIELSVEQLTATGRLIESNVGDAPTTSVNESSQLAVTPNQIT